MERRSGFTRILKGLAVLVSVGGDDRRGNKKHIENSFKTLTAAGILRYLAASE
jgi:hypothetical protein